MKLKNHPSKKESVPGLCLDEVNHDELKFMDEWKDTDIEGMAKNIFENLINSKKLISLIKIINSWKKPRVAFHAMNLMGMICRYQKPVKKTNISEMKKSLVRFSKAVEKCGFGQMRVFPNFAKSLGDLKKAFNEDLVRYATSQDPYSLRKKESYPHHLTLESVRGRGQPTSVMRDRAICFLIRSIENHMELKRSQAVRQGIPLLKLIGCSLDEKHVRSIADKNYPMVTTILPPDSKQIRQLLNQ